MNALAYALQLLQSVPMLVQAGHDVSAAIQRGRQKVEQFQAEGRDPTPTEWDELTQQINGLRTELHAGQQPANVAASGVVLAPGQAGAVQPGAPTGDTVLPVGAVPSVSGGATATGRTPGR